MLIFKTKNRAEQVAKIMIKEQTGIKRISYSFVNNTSCDCNCGETQAVKVTALIKGLAHSEVVGYCDNCGAN